LIEFRGYFRGGNFPLKSLDLLLSTFYLFEHTFRNPPLTD